MQWSKHLSILQHETLYFERYDLNNSNCCKLSISINVYDISFPEISNLYLKSNNKTEFVSQHVR